MRAQRRWCVALQVFDGFPAQARYRGGDVRQEPRLVAPSPQVRLQVAWQKIRRIGLEQQAACRDAGDQRLQLLARGARRRSIR